MANLVSYLCFLTLSVLIGSTWGRETSVKNNPGTNMAFQSIEGPKEAWPWARAKFKCPSLNGVFANTDDCSSFYLCVMGISSKRSCPPFTRFDKYQKKCLPAIIAICDKGGEDKETTESPTTTADDKTTTAKESFLCPSVFGTFTHPTECNKYYTCTFFIPSLKTCPDDELFDGIKLKCFKAKKVDCGSRSKPTEATVLTTVKSTSAPKTTNLKLDLTTLPPITTQEPTTTPAEPTKPTGPPETSCDENDLDCIIDDTGVTPEWFTCLDDIGSYPHPSSVKLFIFCLNWEPSVKKCGLDMIYSTELRTCVYP